MIAQSEHHPERPNLAMIQVHQENADYEIHTLAVSNARLGGDAFNAEKKRKSDIVLKKTSRPKKGKSDFIVLKKM